MYGIFMRFNFQFMDSTVAIVRKDEYSNPTPKNQYIWKL